jgi:UDP-N-acetylmuramoyl-tripeptide--D-alanyl-D-alanine ligase
MVGVPRTVSRAKADTHYLLLELGAFGPGEISHLTTLTRPSVGVVLNVGAAHLGSYRDLDAIANEKSALVRQLSPDGLAVLNADDPRVRAMTDCTRAAVMLVGHGDDAVVRATNTRLDEYGFPCFTLHSPEGSAEVRLRQPGRHHVTNALAAAAVARHAGLPLGGVAARLNNATMVSRWEMQITDRPDGIRVINDAYNASPPACGLREPH